MTIEATHTTPMPHSWIDDIQGFAIGIALVALGATLLKANGLMIGGTAGVAFFIHYLTGWNLGVLFVAVNTPFFLIAYRIFGRVFAAKSVVATLLVAVAIHYLPGRIQFSEISPLMSALMGGLLIGMGVLAFIRHGSSVGGVNTLCLYIQREHGISAGKAQVVLDTLILSSALFFLPAIPVLHSILVALVGGGLIALNHKSGRYMGA